MVSPSSRSTTSHPGRSPSAAPAATTPGTGTPASRAARSRLASTWTSGPWAEPSADTTPLTRCRMRARSSPEGVSRSKASVTLDAPPERRRIRVTWPPSADTQLLGYVGGVRVQQRIHWTPTPPERWVARVRRPGGGTRRCRTLTPCRRWSVRQVHRVSPSLTTVPPDLPMSATRSTSPVSRYTRSRLSTTMACTTRWVSSSSSSSVRSRHSLILVTSPSADTQPRWRSPAAVPRRIPPKCIDSPMLMLNHRHILGPSQRRGPHERSRLP